MALQKANCPDLGRLRGEDLDWLFQLDKNKGGTEVAAWLNNMCQQVQQDSEHMVLTDQEVLQWEQLQRERPECVLEGEALQQAHQAARQAEADDEGIRAQQLSAEQMQERLAALQEELAVHPWRKTAQLASGLAPMQALAAARLARAKKAKEGAADRKLGARQEEVIKLSDRYNEALAEAARAVQYVFEQLEGESVK